MKKFIIAIGAIFAITASRAEIYNKTGSTKNSATERVTLNSLILSALSSEYLPSEFHLIKSCSNVLSSPVITFASKKTTGFPEGAPMIVNMRGEVFWESVRMEMRKQAAYIIACTEFLANRADELSKLLKKQRPDRSSAIKIVAEDMEPFMTYLYPMFLKDFLGQNVEAFVKPGNNGFASDVISIRACDENIQNQAIFNEQTAWGGRTDCQVMRTQINIKGSAVDAINGIPAREAIIKGIFAFNTNPTRIEFPCLDDPIKECGGTYLVDYDGQQVTVMKNGQIWFDTTHIGGAAYSIEISAGRGTNTNSQVNKKGGW